jgi:predicted ArsR family transcriptional regulator
MSICEAIRAYIAQHPGQQSRPIADALGLDRHAVSNACGKMRKRGMLRALRVPADKAKTGRTEYTYFVMRRETISREQRGILAHAARMANPNKPRLPDRLQTLGLAREAAQVAPTVGGQTIEEYLARGGRVERVETRWAAPLGRRQPAMPNRVSVAA